MIPVGLRLRHSDYDSLKMCDICHQPTAYAWLAEENRPSRPVRYWILSRCEKHRCEFSDPKNAWANRSLRRLTEAEVAVLLVMGE